MRLRIVTAFALVLAACGGGDDGAPTSPPGGDPATTVADAAPTTAERPGEPAPDFTMALSDGSSFTLSAEQKPVYMVFWAEW